MAYTTTTNMPLKMPTPGTREPANIALLNDNALVIASHNHTNGLGLAVARLRAGLASARPAASQIGGAYFSTDTGLFSMDTGTVWTDFITAAGTSTVSGWTLIDPIVRDVISFGAEPTGTVDTTFGRAGAGALSTPGSLSVGTGLSVLAGGVTLQAGDQSTQRLTVISNSATAAGNAAIILSRTTPASHDQWLAWAASVSNHDWYLGRKANDDRLYLQSFNGTVKTDRIVFGKTNNFGFGGYPNVNWSTSYPSVLVGSGITLWGIGGAAGGFLSSNTYFDGSARKAIFNNRGTELVMDAAGNFGILQAIAVSPDSTQSFNSRLAISTVGTVTITPDAATNSLVWGSSAGVLTHSGGTAIVSCVGGGFLQLSGGGAVSPTGDNTLALGWGSLRWIAVYAVNGTIQTSSREMKEDFSDVSAADALEAVRRTPIVRFKYKLEEPLEIAAVDPVEFVEAEGVRPEGLVVPGRPAQVVAPMDRAGREQIGFVAEDADPLLTLEDNQSVSPQHTASVALLAIQALLLRVEALENAGRGSDAGRPA